MSGSVDIEVLFCDTALLVVNKPAGLSTLPDGYNPSLPHVKSLLESNYGRLWTVHRLDKETSGVLVLARTADAHRSLNTQFELHQTVKVYHALVIGPVDWQEKTVDFPLRPDGDRRHRTVVDPLAGKPAITRLKVMERLGHYCLVEAIPETGRTHQIRANLFALGLSIVGDKLYTRRVNHKPSVEESRNHGEVVPAPPISTGMALHAWSLEINHPLTKERMKFTAPYPPALSELLQQLRRIFLEGKG